MLRLCLDLRKCGRKKKCRENHKEKNIYGKKMQVFLLVEQFAREKFNNFQGAWICHNNEREGRESVREREEKMNCNIEREKMSERVIERQDRESYRERGKRVIERVEREWSEMNKFWKNLNKKEKEKWGQIIFPRILLSLPKWEEN